MPKKKSIVPVVKPGRNFGYILDNVRNYLLADRNNNLPSQEWTVEWTEIQKKIGIEKKKEK